MATVTPEELERRRAELARAETRAARQNRVLRLLVAAIALGLLAFPALRGTFSAFNYVIQVLIVIMMFTAMASSWNIMGGFAGYISLGHNVFMVIGAYVAGMLLVYRGVSPFISVFLGVALAVVVGVLFGLVTLRTRGPAFIIASIALLLMTRLMLDNWDAIEGANGLSLPIPDFFPTLGKVPMYYGMLAAAFGAVGLAYGISRSKFGLALRAIAMDEIKAEVAGIDTRRYKIIALALSAIFIAWAGTFWGYTLNYLRPSAFLSVAIAADMALMSIVGGKGTVAGPPIGAFLIILVTELSVWLFGPSELNLAISGTILIVVLLFFPLGIVGTLQSRQRDRLARLRAAVEDTGEAVMKGA
ncbi:MAG: hypothetical protein RLZZ353_334 [Actinomycetota bacterium]|jgi:branched-chain amino acid transport system permease protein